MHSTSPPNSEEHMQFLNMEHAQIPFCIRGEKAVWLVMWFYLILMIHMVLHSKHLTECRAKYLNFNVFIHFALVVYNKCMILATWRIVIIGDSEFYTVMLENADCR